MHYAALLKSTLRKADNLKQYLQLIRMNKIIQSLRRLAPRQTTVINNYYFYGNSQNVGAISQQTSNIHEK